MKQNHYIFGLLGVGAVLVLYLLWKESQGGTAATVEPTILPGGTTTQQYPNPNPIQQGDITIGATPPFQNYNLNPQIPTVQVGSSLSDCGCADDDCDTAGLPVTVQTISPDVLQSAVSNFQSFISKTTPKTTSGVQAARETFVAA